MRFAIKHEIKGRLRVHYPFEHLSFREADTLEYYLKREEGLWFVSENTKKDVSFLLRMLAEKGRTETFSYIKNVYLKGREL